MRSVGPEMDFAMFRVPYYQFYELSHAAIGPARMAADVTKLMFRNPLNPFSATTMGKSIAASCELFERTTRRYAKPDFGLSTTLVGGERVNVTEEIVWKKPFCRLVHFQRSATHHALNQPKILLVAPMSGHYATLLRGTVETFLPKFEVYITDWEDARMVPLSAGRFDLDDYIDYLIAMIEYIGPDVHVIAVCQPSVPVLAAVSLMNEDENPLAPLTMTLMGGPIDTRRSPTAVNDLAADKPMSWFSNNCIMRVPFPHAGVMRDVYPGFLQLGGFMGMNLDRHIGAHKQYFQHLIEGDGDSVTKHRDFYDEYLAVMDLTAEFYLDTIEKVFKLHALPEGTLTHRGRLIKCSEIRQTALFTVEGEKDDITGRGQTAAAQDLCSALKTGEMKFHYEQPGVGHYGVFNGSRFRAEIAPRISDFIRSNQMARGVEAQASAATAPAPAGSAAPKITPAKARATSRAAAVKSTLSKLSPRTRK